MFVIHYRTLFYIMGVIKYHRARTRKRPKKKESKQGNLIPFIQDDSDPFFKRRYQPSNLPPTLYPNLRWKITKSEKAWSWVPFVGGIQIAKKAFRCNHESSDLEASYLLKNQACSLTMFAGAAVLGPPALITLCGVTIFNATLASSREISRMKLKNYKQNFVDCKKRLLRKERRRKST